jgi:hypothetical protein
LDGALIIVSKLFSCFAQAELRVVLVHGRYASVLVGRHIYLLYVHLKVLATGRIVIVETKRRLRVVVQQDLFVLADAVVWGFLLVVSYRSVYNSLRRDSYGVFGLPDGLHRRNWGEFI